MNITINKIFKSNFKNEIYYLIGENSEGVEYKVKGKFNPDLDIGDTIHLMKMSRVDEYLECEYYEKVRGKNLSFIYNFLVSEIKGIGEKRANDIVNKFGEQTIHVIENETNKLLEVEKIGMETASKVKESYEAIPKEKVKYMLIGLSSIIAEKAMHRFQYEEITHNPYLLMDVEGIGWVKSDFIAKSLGYDLMGEYRLHSAVQESMRVNTEVHGHTYIQLEELIKKTCDLLVINSEENKSVIEGTILRMVKS